MGEYTVECKAVGWCGSYSTKELAENRKAQLDFHNPECSPHTIVENPQPKGGEQMTWEFDCDHCGKWKLKDREAAAMELFNHEKEFPSHFASVCNVLEVQIEGA